MIREILLNQPIKGYLFLLKYEIKQHTVCRQYLFCPLPYIQFKRIYTILNITKLRYMLLYIIYEESAQYIRLD